MDMEERVLNKLDELSSQITELKLEVSKLPNRFVTKREWEAQQASIAKAKHDAAVTRRWQVSTSIVVAGILLQTLGVF